MTCDFTNYLENTTISSTERVNESIMFQHYKIHKHKLETRYKQNSDISRRIKNDTFMPILQNKEISS